MIVFTVLVLALARAPNSELLPFIFSSSAIALIFSKKVTHIRDVDAQIIATYSYQKRKTDDDLRVAIETNSTCYAALLALYIL